MPELDAIPRDDLARIGTATIVVGIPSYNNAETIGPLAHATHAALTKFFSAQKGVIVHADGGSTDGTPKHVLDALGDERALLQVTYPVYPVHHLAVPRPGIPGRGKALQTIFTLAHELGAEACVVLDPELQSVDPEWIAGLVRPLLEQEADFVAPSYLRDRFDGLLATGVVYPMLRALYGACVRHPLGSDFGISARLRDHYLGQDVWARDGDRFDVDLWLTMRAIAGGYALRQAFFGPKGHSGHEPEVDLSETLARVVGTLFAEVERTAETWQKARSSAPVPLAGARVAAATPPVSVSIARLIESFQLGCRTLQEIWALILSPATLLDLRRLARATEATFRLADEVWIHAVYEFALAYRLRPIGREHLLSAMTPLYLGWVASFVREVQQAGAGDAEERVERLCLAYEAQKPYLISRWRWPDRFNP